MNVLEKLAEIVGPEHVLTDTAAQKYGQGWNPSYHFQPGAVVRPGTTEEVSALMRVASDTETPIIPVSGNTGMTGATYAPGGLLLSLERLNKIRDVRPNARIAVVEAGAILSSIHDAVDAHDLVFPLTFGARGSAMIGGALSTNAGGSNVVRYGSTRGLCLGLEVVLADGRVMDLMSELHKDNSGYDLKDLFIGAEGTLGVITAAVVRLFPKPKAYATAMVACPSLDDALTLLNQLQIATGGLVEAFEYMPGSYIRDHMAHFDGARAPFDSEYEVNIMVEIGATAPRDASPSEDGAIPVVTYLEETLAAAMEEGGVLDAVVAKTEGQRREMWARREAAAEVALARLPHLDSDVCLPTDKVATFFGQIETAVSQIDPGATGTCVAHLGDGNIHLSTFPASHDAEVHARIKAAIEDVTRALGGSFSAEHGIGLSKKPGMERYKSPVALDVMRSIKMALDPKGILNPGKVLP